MGELHWFATNYGEWLQNAGIIGGLWFSAYSAFKDERARKVSNLIAVTQSYQEIWRSLYENPQLKRVLKPQVDLTRCPITDEERLFINTLILHLDCVRQATKEGMLGTIAGVQKDIKDFFTQPIPKEVWETSKTFRSPDFIKFIESSRR